MSCTTILVGKNATYDGSTMIARNDDSPSGEYSAKKFVKVSRDEQPRKYKSVISHLEIDLPDNPMSYTATPDAAPHKGIWAACGVNEKEVGMSATETITSNERVLGADPLVEYRKKTDTEEEKIGGIGEEDFVVLILPYINSAREGVIRLGELLEKYGTYEMNALIFSDKDEIWVAETIGGHHFIAKRVDDNSYVVMPNQQGIDEFDLEDAFSTKKNHMCSSDLREFIKDNFLDLSLGDEFDVRAAFGSHEDADHVYNTPRAWYMLRHFNPNCAIFDGIDADFTPESDDLPWQMVPEKKITPEDVKYILSSHFQGTPYDPYILHGDKSMKDKYRTIGINRTDFFGFVQIRPYMIEGARAIEWVSFASNPFNAMVPFYTNVNKTPSYMNATTDTVSTDSFYWTSKLIGVLADASYALNSNNIERYQISVLSKAHEILNIYDKKIKNHEYDDLTTLLEEANEKMSEMVRKESLSTLKDVLLTSADNMKNAYGRSDA